MNSNPSSLQEVKDFAKKYPDPIVEAGIKLEGVGETELNNIPDNGKVPGLKDSTNPDAKQFEDYVQLPARGEGNCFLYA